MPTNQINHQKKQDGPPPHYPLPATHYPLLTGMIGLFALTLALMIIACDSGPTHPEDVVFPESDVSYRTHVQPLFDVGCNFSGCHNTIDRAGNVSLASYFDLLNTPGLVVPGEPGSSLLIQTLRGQQPHTFSIQSIVDENQVEGVATWVEEGASNN